ncbi:30S ribosomal protein S6 [Neoconidiobolus thromboides FSU 785]|nr:30S ribosomal protein S6 [Neoconidiobolus thromboides FSU 785]
MPLYELSLIVRPKLNPNNIKDLMKRSVQTIWNHKGVVTEIKDLHQKTLPYPMKRHQEYFHAGRYYLLNFHANPNALVDLGNKLKVDPRVIRHGIIKVADKIDTEPRA